MFLPRRLVVGEGLDDSGSFALALGHMVLQLGLVDSGDSHQVFLQAALQDLSAVHGNGNAGGNARFRVNVMAAADSSQPPSPGLENLAEPSTADRLHTAISITRSESDMGIC